MKIEEKIEIEKWQILKQLKRDFLLTPSDEYVTYEIIKGREDYPLPEDQIKIIEIFQHLGALKIIRNNYLSATTSNIGGEAFAVYGFKPKGIVLNIIEENFNKLFYEYEEKYHFLENLSAEEVSNFYITKKGDDFYYDGKIIDISKKSSYKTFSALYALIPHGGQVSYEDLGEEIKTKIEGTKKYSEQEMRKFILTNLTDTNNGFARRAKIRTLDNGKKLLLANRGIGIFFNNKMG